MFVDKNGYFFGCCDEAGCKNEIQTGVETATEGSEHSATQWALAAGWAIGPYGTWCPMHAGVPGAHRDLVNHPQHYNTGKIEVIAAIEDWRLGFHEGNVVKYVARAEHKGKQLEDLKKARWYLDRRIEQLEAAGK